MPSDKTADPTPSTPLYHQLKEFIRQQIENDAYAPGDRIPTEQEFTERFSVSRITARRAISDLVAEGLLYRHRGRGTFVAKPKFTQSLARTESLTTIARGQGRLIRSRLLGVQIIQADRSLGGRLQVPPGTPIFEVQRVREQGDEPIIFHKSYYPVTLFPELDQADLASGSMYQLMEEEYGMRALEQEHVMQLALATDFEAGVLHTKPHAALFLVTITTYTAGKRPIEVVKVLYRGDRCQFTVTPHRVEL